MDLRLNLAHAVDAEPGPLSAEPGRLAAHPYHVCLDRRKANEMTLAHGISRDRLILIVALIAALVLAAFIITVLPHGEAHADHGGPHGVTVEPLVPVTFPDQIDARFRVKYESGGMKVIHVRDLDHVFNAKITFEPDGYFPWHSHPGPVVVAIQQGALTLVNASDCVPRVYEAGEGFVDLGHGWVHRAVNESGGTTVLHATFFEVPVVNGAPQASLIADGPDC
jgi:quercetin dioxygenase-like cupin family protein